MLFENINGIAESGSAGSGNAPVKLCALPEGDLYIYPKSINAYNDIVLFTGKTGIDKNLYVVAKDKNNEDLDKFTGEFVKTGDGEEIKKCLQIHANALVIQELFDFTKPQVLGLANSFGFGDRIGLANPAHVRSLEGSDFKPIFAQQSIRELTRTKRTPDQVMDAAIWAVFQEGYKTGFGADADHLKTPADIDLMMNAGFTMFTFDPGEYVINEADSVSIPELEEKAKSLNWAVLGETVDGLVKRYKDVEFDLKEGLTITPDYESVMRALVKYGNSIAHIKTMFDHLSTKYADRQYEVEISVDETESVTTPFEHFFMASELNRLGVKLISLAPRFIGEFEKGIDYKGDLDVFKTEYLKHVKIAEYFGSYKISLHSGSDKFDVYRAIGSLKRGYTHVKTAGTSYLEALKVVASIDPVNFRDILNFARVEYEKEKESYHVSADLKHVKPAEEYSDEELVGLFTQNDARQILHVTFGKVLTTLDDKGNYLFKGIIYKALEENEDLHYKFLINHFNNHLNPFK